MSGCVSSQLPFGLADELAEALDALSGEIGAAGSVLDPEVALADARARHDELMRSRATIGRGTDAVTMPVGTEVVVGRRGGVRVDDPVVSRRHLVVCHRPGSLTCADLGSANGSWLVRDGARTTLGRREVALVAGDRVVTAGDVELIRVIEVG
jgi:hypothetical protein